MTADWEECDRPVWTEGVAAPIRHQHPLHAAASAATGKRMRHFALHHRGALVGAAQIGLRRWPGWGDFAVLGRGPLWAHSLDDDDRQSALYGLLARLRRDHRGVMAAPDLIGGTDPLEDSPWLPVVTPISLAELPLDAAPETLRARLGQKWRNRLRRAEASDLSIRHAPWIPDAGHWLLRAEARQRAGRRYRGADAGYTLAWALEGGPGATRLFSAQADGKTVAAMLFLLHPPAASYHIGWTNEVGRARGAHNLILWRATLWLAAHGYRALDLDTIDTETAPGLARFKLGAGARVVTLGSTRLSAPGTGLVRRLTARRAAHHAA